MWEIKPILTVLWRNRTSALLVVIQIALTLAIISHALFVILERVTFVNRDTGINEAGVFNILVQPLDRSIDRKVMLETDLAAMKNTPGVLSVTSPNHLPVDLVSNRTSLSNALGDHGKLDVAYVMGDEQYLDTFGIGLVAGRNFTREEVQRYQITETLTFDVALISESTAKALFPDAKVSVESALNQTVYFQETTPLTVIGIYKDYLAGNPHQAGVARSVIVPVTLLRAFNMYSLRTVPEQQDRLMREIETLLTNTNINININTNGERVVEQPTTMIDIKQRVYRDDIAMIRVLSVCSVLLALITAVGIIGITVFWVNQRRKHIGTRRALGATRLAIVRYFLTENALICLLGITLGTIIALAANGLLIQYQNMNPLEPRYIAITAVMLLLMSVSATIWPAIRAANIAPALAAKSV